MRLQKIIRDDRGASMVEFSIIVSLFFVVLFGLIEFSLALYQWNSATKAVQLGARLAAVSSPVWNQLADMALVGSQARVLVGNDVLLIQQTTGLILDILSR